MGIGKFFAAVPKALTDPKLAASLFVADEVRKATLFTAKTIKSSLGPKSITRISKESIFQYPCIMSGSINPDDIGVIGKALEKNFAAHLITAISTENGVNHAKYSSIRDYLKEFHTNDRIPSSITDHPILESATEIDCVSLDQNFVESLWDITEEQMDMEPLNDVYQPYTKTKKAFETSLSRIESAKAMEANGDPTTFSGAVRYAKSARYKSELKDIKQGIYQNADGSPNMYGNLKNIGDDLRKASGGNYNPNNNRSVETNEKIATDNSGKIIRDKDGNPVIVTSTKFAPAKNDYLAVDGRFAIVEDKGIANLPPTMINVTFMNYDTTSGSNVSWTQNVILGVKAMIRIVRSNIMISNMVEAARDSNTAFKFINYTKGEVKLHHLLFGTKKYKEMALPNANNRWLKDLKVKAASASVSKFNPLSHRMMPNTTIIITEGEALQIKDACGVDFHQMTFVKNLMKKYFLLGFGIYNTDTKILDMFFDGDDSFSATTLRQLVGIAKKDMNLLDAGI